MRVTILAFIAKLLGIQFTIYGLPHGASYRRSVKTLSTHPRLAKWGPPTDDDEWEVIDGPAW